MSVLDKVDALKRKRDELAGTGQSSGQTDRNASGGSRDTAYTDAAARNAAIREAASRGVASMGAGVLESETARQTNAGGGGGGGSQNPYTAQAQALYEQLMNRGGFQFDLQGDPFYRQYADQYSQLGQQAMRDVMGTAAGLTGGYGNSYASTAGNLAYQQYLGQLNGMIPDFYDRAYQAWQNQGDDLLMRYQLALEQANAAGGGGGGTRSQEEEDSAYQTNLANALQAMMQGISGVTQPAAANPLTFEYFNELWQRAQNR